MWRQLIRLGLIVSFGRALQTIWEILVRTAENLMKKRKYDSEKHKNILQVGEREKISEIFAIYQEDQIIFF